ncbi:MAG: leucine--tRNA ligase [Nitrospinota bacterium]
MEEKYNHLQIEKKWQKKWEEDGLYCAMANSKKPKHYALTMFPYPSGDLHIGHWYAIAPSDAKARYMVMKGHNVLFPMGFDGFGLPAENAAIKLGIHPHKWTMKNIERMRDQLKSMGTMVDWSKEIITCHPDYYKWNQWFFLKFLEKGLAYKKRSSVDWCPNCNTTLAREQVWGDDRHCERCQTPVIKKNLDQWFLKITKYQDELLDFSELNWPDRVIKMQAQWIGRSEGADITFMTEQGDPMTVFTTRPDTLYGVTFMAIGPEHPLVKKLTTSGKRGKVEKFIKGVESQTEIDRLAVDKEKEGVFAGSFAVHPLSGKKIPIWIGDYVLMEYGTGAVMGVPAHDQRDFLFAKKYGLDITVVVAPHGWDGKDLTEAHVDAGEMVNSDSFNGISNEDAKKAITDYLNEKNCGKTSITYRLRDWLISRQRYWGTPIPIINCKDCGMVPVSYEDLPVTLPEDAEFKPTGESPLKFHEGFLKTTCPKCKKDAERETDTMDTFICSSWYQYADLSPYQDKGPFDKKTGEYWLPVDQYTGGIEHATMHLLYTRFFTKVLRDIGLVDFNEPMLNLFNQGIILGEDSEKMSKSRGNVVNPDKLIEEYGADIVRTYLMFIGPWDEGGPWNSRGIEGASRFMYRVWNTVLDKKNVGGKPTEKDILRLKRLTHKTIKRTTEDIDSFKFNTMIAALMEFNNELIKLKETPLINAPEWKDAVKTIILLLAPIAPHITEELWHRIGNENSVHRQNWPKWDSKFIKEDIFTLVVQVNGKVRDKMEIPVDMSEDEIKTKAMLSKKVGKYVDGKQVIKSIYVRNKLLNLVVK